MRNSRNEILHLITFLSLLFLCGCTSIQMSHGTHHINNQRISTISMVEMYNVLESQFPDYETELIPVPESSSFMLAPEWGRAYVPPHHYISMRSNEADVLIQHDIRSSVKNNPLVGIRIHYYPRGENSRERLNELNKPMREIKQCLIDNFPDMITEDDFTETFYKAPHEAVTSLYMLTFYTLAMGAQIFILCLIF